MIDPNLIRNNLEVVAENLKKRGMIFDLASLESLESERKQLQIDTQALQNERNGLSKQIGQIKSKGGDASDLLKQAESLREALEKKETLLNALLEKQQLAWSYLPNMLHASVPVGKDENDNVEIRRWGTPTKLNFTPKDHVDLTASSGLMDFEAASRMSGARFVVLRGQIAALHRALAQWMLSVHTLEHGYQEAYVPYLVEAKALYGVGQLPKFAEDMFKIAGDKEMYLISTAEVSLTNLVRESIIPGDQLPLKFVSHSPCFRSEAGSYGKDTKGMIRQHQFDKVELVQVVRPEDSYAALEALTNHAETILQRLELPYRVMALSSGDIGFQSSKTYDLEVWLPSQQKYREISSCSNTESFQARRMQARYKPSSEAKPDWVHTLNGSGLAVGRTLIAVLENYQDAEGNVHIPKVLHPFVGDLRTIKLV